MKVLTGRVAPFVREVIILAIIFAMRHTLAISQRKTLQNQPSVRQELINLTRRVQPVTVARRQPTRARWDKPVVLRKLPRDIMLHQTVQPHRLHAWLAPSSRATANKRVELLLSDILLLLPPRPHRINAPREPMPQIKG
ncbi:MAG: hypothetical protein COB46_11350 [Rhodospirillaceae bacterium]|nr:MAG: hypothetical protein COB46_11350 [Rhodospirillaceae bacterium]